MMSSGCEDSSVNTMGIRGIPEKWDCGRSTGIYTSKSRQNPGRTFFRCPTFRNKLSSILFNFFLKKLDSHLSFFEYRMMSSGCEDSSVNTMGIRGIPEKWDCGRSTGIYTSKSRQNPGRTFFRCPTFRNVSV
ncbi:hypothetical protein F2Q69_00046022 [Brassica cretica]|uniref:Zinc finger GRF-type domain-containing protein n=1 Tax=Brassica cretica TaxID=69181 RepID=A0A8S9PNB7_BRACR|nr:hypothetical protein F2Q69_00046022 [Brassica cretica]